MTVPRATLALVTPIDYDVGMESTTTEEHTVSDPTTTCIIKPTDFGTQRPSSHPTWSAGNLQLVVNALDGAPVWIVLDSQTGHMARARLIGVVASMRGSNYDLVVEFAYSDGPTQVRCSVFRIGDIVPLEQTNAKWDASHAYYELSSKTLAVAKEQLGAEKWYGKWTGTVCPDGESMVWTYETQVRDWVEGQETGPRYASTLASALVHEATA